MDIKSRFKNVKLSLVIGLFIIAFLVLFFWPRIFISIKPGEVGVLYSRMLGGTIMDRVYNEGAHVIVPWDIMYPYDTRLKEHAETFNMLSQNGLTIGVTASIRYQVIPGKLPELHKQIGPEYERKIIYPTFTSSIREAIGRYLPEELYTTARQEVQDIALIEAVNEVSRLPVLINNIVIKRISLPKNINDAIEAKLSEEQANLMYQFILQRTFQEAKRKVLESEGIRLYQQAVNEGMTDNYLKFEGIKATKELAKSSNAKLVIVGGKDGLPLILNPDGPSLKPEQPAAEAKAKAAPENKTTGETDVNATLNLEGINKKMRDLWENLGQNKMPEDFLKQPQP